MNGERMGRQAQHDLEAMLWSARMDMEINAPKPCGDVLMCGLSNGRAYKVTHFPQIPLVGKSFLNGLVDQGAKRFPVRGREGEFGFVLSIRTAIRSHRKCASSLLANSYELCDYAEFGFVWRQGIFAG
jgi:hypothetical protein